MKGMKAIVLAATILTSTLGAFPKHASAAVNAYLIVEGPPPPPPPPPTSAVKTSNIVSIVISLLLG